MPTKPYTPCDNGSMALRHEDVAALLPFSGRKLGDLCRDNPNLLAFPGCLGANGDEIDTTSLFELGGETLQVGNTVGFWGVNGVHVHVHSRFDTADRQYFFHYMLQRVCGINVLNLQTLPDPEENLWEFLMYLFPLALKRAMAQGVFRAYRTFAHDDNHLRGPISISTFLRKDMPFCGRISYTTREHTPNNHVVQLVRHTIEFIRQRQSRLLVLDQETRQSVDMVVQLTPDYAVSQRNKVVAANLRPVRHPYYTEYTWLQSICLRILRHERLAFGTDDDKICGIVFDAAWLWEEYLAAVFAEHPWTRSFIHPQNKRGLKGINLFVDRASRRFPDFYDPSRRLVLDAKYKRGEGGVAREDLYQVISYVHVLKSSCGVLLYPAEKTGSVHEGTLAGYGGEIRRVFLGIPNHVDGSFSAFAEDMRGSEDAFVNKLMNTFGS